MGLVSACRRAADGLVTLEKRTFYLYESEPGAYKRINEEDVRPRIGRFDFLVIRSPEQIEDMVRAGTEFPLRLDEIERRLRCGVISFAIITEGEVAFMGWAATSERAKATINRYPYRVDFAAGEACVGGGLTSPKYRNKGLFTYESYRRQKYLEENGVSRTRSVVERDNIASQKVHAKLGDKAYARARYLRVAGIQFWTQRPFLENPLQASDGGTWKVAQHGSIPDLRGGRDTLRPVHRLPETADGLSHPRLPAIPLHRLHQAASHDDPVGEARHLRRLLRG
jgi:hypothetical protein